MKQLTLAGHPLHPILIVGPAGLMPFSAVMDVMHLATGRKTYADAAYYSLVGGVGSAAAAGVAGFMDYLTISPGGPMKQTANTHALMNVGLLALQSVNLALRKKRKSGWLPTLLNLVSNAGLLISAWYGGELVYKHGMRVKPATERPQPEAKLPGDDALAHGFEKLSSLMPAGGPGRED